MHIVLLTVYIYQKSPVSVTGTPSLHLLCQSVLFINSQMPLFTFRLYHFRGLLPPPSGLYYYYSDADIWMWSIRNLAMAPSPLSPGHSARWWCSLLTNELTLCFHPSVFLSFLYYSHHLSYCFFLASIWLSDTLKSLHPLP